MDSIPTTSSNHSSSLIYSANIKRTQETTIIPSSSKDNLKKSLGKKAISNQESNSDCQLEDENSATAMNISSNCASTSSEATSDQAMI